MPKGCKLDDDNDGNCAKHQPSCPPIDTFNKFMVASHQGNIVFMRPPMKLTPDEALSLAATIVALAEHDATHRFEDVLNAVQNA